MTNPAEPDRDDLLEAYLDGLLNDAEREAFAESLRADPARRRQVELQTRIDGALDRLFHVETPSHEQVAEALAGAVAPARMATFGEGSAAAPGRAMQSGSRIYWAAAGLAAAAAIAWVIASLTGSQPRANEPFFAARPLAEIYRDALSSGFEPTYDCREQDRFAATFSLRQGQPLRLLATPSGTTMLGLAYVGGLSRNTTAMLCRVDGRPVMVFVDRASSDQPKAADVSGDDLHVFREERDGLVYYEVTPFDSPRVTELFAPATAAGGEPAPVAGGG